MRDILFRGFHPCDNGTQAIVLNGNRITGEWVEGLYFKSPLTAGSIDAPVEDGWNFLSGKTRYCIADEHGCVEEIIPETLGQFTGMLDKNGKKIFEGNILKDERGNTITCLFEVKDGISLFNLFDKEHPKRMYFHIDELFEILGTIFDEVRE